MDLVLDMVRHGDTTVIRARGDIDIASAPQIRHQVIDAIAQGGRDVVIDLDTVDFLDSTGLGVLVGALKRVRTGGGELRLVCTQPRILKVFDITGLDRVFEIHGSVASATAASAAG